MSQKSSASTASTPSKTPGSKYTVTEDHEKKALQYGFMCEPLDVTRKSARFTCQWCEKSRKLTIDCSKSYIIWFDIVGLNAAISICASLTLLLLLGTI